MSEAILTFHGLSVGTVEMLKGATLRRTARLIRNELRYRAYRPERLLFDHLPKCGGTGITHYLLQHYPGRLVFRTDSRHPLQSVDGFRSLPVSVRLGYQLIIGHEAHRLLDDVHGETNTLTVFRDPVDRIVSHFFYVRQDRDNYLHDRVVNGNIDLDGYVSLELSSELRN